MNAGATAERVYDGLKRRLLSGMVIPGERIEPERFAQELSSSVTPVRDALNRLVGERLLATRHAEGFHLPFLSEAMLRDLYGWNDQLLHSVARYWPRAEQPVPAERLPADLARATPIFFASFAARSDSREHAAQIESANDRLATARIAERRVLPDQEGELRLLAVAFDHGSTAELLRVVSAYHRRRIAAAPRILRAMYEPNR